jgi:hypothetical protein
MAGRPNEFQQDIEVTHGKSQFQNQLASLKIRIKTDVDSNVFVSFLKGNKNIIHMVHLKNIRRVRATSTEYQSSRMVTRKKN